MKTKLITLFLVAALGTSFSSIATNEPPGQQDPPKLVDCGANLVIGGLVIAVGAVIYIGLKRFCEKHLPPEPPAPPPPPPNNCTNCNPSHPSWPCTNCPPSLNGLGKSFSGEFKLLQLDVESLNYEDIQAQGWSDPFGNPYCLHFRCRIESSTNMIGWNTLYELNGYVSFKLWGGTPRWPSNSVVLLSDAQGVPVCTNWSWLEQNLPVDTNSGPRRFYRLAHD